ncbi:MAG: hypothetical protein ACP5OA_07505 [Candidatus Woesearchaeota archaeon]
MIVAQFAVLLVIAVIMIFIVTAFGAKIWSSIFPSDDKSTLKSFETLYTTINMISQSPLDYDSITLGTYLAKNYEVIYFNEPVLQCEKQQTYTTGGMVPTSNTYTVTKEYYMPTECEPNKQCICLYDDDPVDNEDKRNKNVVKCRSMTETMNIDPGYFILNRGVCYPDMTKWNELIIAKNSTNNGNYLFILEDNEVNRKLDAEWNSKRCPADTDSNGVVTLGICYDAKDGTIIIPETDDELDRIYQFCYGQGFKSTSVKCTYEATGNCQIECDISDVNSKCGITYTKCSDFNKGIGVVNYINAIDDRELFLLCEKDMQYYCNLGCEISDWDTYICMNTIDGSISSTACNALPIGCNEERLADRGTLNKFIKSYDITNDDCRIYMEQNFYLDKHKILACKQQDMNSECVNFVNTRKGETDCNLKFLSVYNNYWITYYNPNCEYEVKELFSEAYFCTNSATT